MSLKNLLFIKFILYLINIKKKIKKLKFLNNNKIYLIQLTQSTNIKLKFNHKLET